MNRAIAIAVPIAIAIAIAIKLPVVLVRPWGTEGPPTVPGCRKVGGPIRFPSNELGRTQRRQEPGPKARLRS